MDRRPQHNYIGTEHLLLAGLSDEESPSGSTLAEMGITKARAEQWLIPELKRIGQAKRAG
jgi:ATP-dependent Clp protease ATP-binding subunit ClpA